jgi:hypothetical protein
MVSWAYFDLFRAEQEVLFLQTEKARRVAGFHQTHRSPSILRSLLARMGK